MKLCLAALISSFVLAAAPASFASSEGECQRYFSAFGQGSHLANYGMKRKTDLRKIAQSTIDQIRDLQSWGAVVTPDDFTFTELTLGLIKGVTVPSQDIAHDFRTGIMLDFVKFPTPVKNANALTPAVLHPEFKKKVQELSTLGYRVLIDTSLDGINYLGLVRSDRILTIGVHSKWVHFVHELQHVDFDVFVDQAYSELELAAKTGKDIRPLLSEAAQAKLGERRIKNLQKLLKRSAMTKLAVNETLSFKEELQALGFKQFIPFSGERAWALKSENYIFGHQADSIDLFAQHGSKGVREARRRLSAKSALNRARKWYLPEIALGSVAAVYYNRESKLTVIQKKDGRVTVISPKEPGKEPGKKPGKKPGSGS